MAPLLLSGWLGPFGRHGPCPCLSDFPPAALPPAVGVFWGPWICGAKWRDRWSRSGVCGSATPPPPGVVAVGRGGVLLVLDSPPYDVVVEAVMWALAFPPSQSPAVVCQGIFYVCGIDEVWGVPLGTKFVGGMRT